MRKQLEFSLQELLGVGFTIVVLGIGLAYGVDVVSDVGDGVLDTVNGAGANPGCNATSREACNLEYNATADAVTSVGNITGKLQTIATVVVASVIIGILVTYLWARFARM